MLGPPDEPGTAAKSLIVMSVSPVDEGCTVEQPAQLSTFVFSLFPRTMRALCGNHSSSRKRASTHPKMKSQKMRSFLSAADSSTKKWRAYIRTCHSDFEYSKGSSRSFVRR